MIRIAIAAGLMMTPAVTLAQLGAGMGTNAYAQPQSHAADVASGAAGTPVHKSHVAHYRHHAAKAHAKQATHATVHHDTPAPDGTTPH